MIEITQTCDMCGISRKIDGTTPDHKMKSGWRLIPVRSQYGEMRDEQPWLCPPCLGQVFDFILKTKREHRENRN